MNNKTSEKVENMHWSIEEYKNYTTGGKKAICGKYEAIKMGYLLTTPSHNAKC